MNGGHALTGPQTSTAQEPVMSKTWSAQQEQIFGWFSTVDADGNLVVRARAGTGKTTTIIEGVNRAPDAKILLCAFNKKIALELQARLSNPRAQAKTLHALGFSFVTRFWEGIFVGRGNDRELDLAQRACGGRAPDAILKLVAKLHTKAREIAPLATQIADVVDLAEQFDCVPDEEWEEEGFSLDYVCASALKAMELAAAAKPSRTGIDFADMIFLPIRNGWLRPTYDLVVVDEAQDMTNAQLLLARGVCKGRICIVGDDRQAIYAFRGADSKSIDRLKDELKATELGLTVTYRCGKTIVALAARLVPDFTAHTSNLDGAIVDLDFAKLVDAAQAGDFILSRKNAPLANVAMSFVRAQRRVRVAGKDIGAGLLSVLKKNSKGKASKSVAEFLARLDTWEQREVARAAKAGRDARAELVRDQAETLRVLAENVVGLRELEARIADLFTDNPEAGAVLCSSVHKSKGLEADRVFVLRDTLKKGDIEEENIEYVAITRAKHQLTWVNGLPGQQAATPEPKPQPSLFAA
jgi:superfamily I DNA/RNA helicase